MNPNYYCVIMAGGIGSRFWPMSRTKNPKQFIDILGTGKTFIQMTFDRLKRICPAENILIVTNDDYKDLVLEQLPEVKASRVLCEPQRRNTAPCIAYANYKIIKENPEATVLVAPSDHLILQEDEFIKRVKQGMQFASKYQGLLTMGITPSRPETGYGYIQVCPEKIDNEDESLRKVKTFTEKPDLDLARVFLESGEFYWNSGMFIWKAQTIQDAFQKHLPDVYAVFSEGIEHYNTPSENDFIKTAYASCKNISIDYGIMEKADNVFVLCADFGWSDLGTWGSLYEHSDKDDQGNVKNSDHLISYDSENCIIQMPKEKLAIIQGMKDFIIIDSGDVLLICKKEDEQNIKQFVRDLGIKYGDKYI